MLWQKHHRILRLIHMCVVVIITQHFLVQVHMMVWRICYLGKKMSMPITSNLMMRDLVDLGPLAKISGDKKVVLGLITTKKPDLENKKEIVERIKQAAQYIPLDRLYLSPQCGFASCEIGNKLTEEEQWAKLKLVKEIAEEVWK